MISMYMYGVRVYVARSTVASAGASLIIGAKICTMALQLVQQCVLQLVDQCPAAAWRQVPPTGPGFAPPSLHSAGDGRRQIRGRAWPYADGDGRRPDC